MNVIGLLDEILVHGPKDFDAVNFRAKYEKYISDGKTDAKKEKRVKKVHDKLLSIKLTVYAEIVKVRALPGFDAKAYENYALLFDTPQLYEHRALVRLERQLAKLLKSVLTHLENACATETVQGEQQPGGNTPE